MQKSTSQFPVEPWITVKHWTDRQVSNSSLNFLTGCLESYAKFIKDKKVDTTIKDQVNEKYAMEVWEKLKTDAREAHSFKDCQVVNSPILSF